MFEWLHDFYKKIFICFKLSINVQNYKINCGQRSKPRHRPTRLCPYANEVNRPNLHTEPPIGCSQFAWLLGEHVGTPWNGVRMRDPVEIGCAPLVRGFCVRNLRVIRWRPWYVWIYLGLWLMCSDKYCMTLVICITSVVTEWTFSWFNICIRPVTEFDLCWPCIWLTYDYQYPRNKRFVNFKTIEVFICYFVMISVYANPSKWQYLSQTIIELR